jgi:hypothetical protein
MNTQALHPDELDRLAALAASLAEAQALSTRADQIRGQNRVTAPRTFRVPIFAN